MGLGLLVAAVVLSASAGPATSNAVPADTLPTYASEATRALVAVDVNTGSDLSNAAALKANLAAIRDLPRQLRLRGLGGQIVVDLAPLAKSDRRRIEAALASALRDDGIDTTLVGWTPLGHLEILRKRARRPLVGADAILPRAV